MRTRPWVRVGIKVLVLFISSCPIFFNKKQQPGHFRTNKDITSTHICHGTGCLFKNLCFIGGEYIYFAKSEWQALHLKDFLSRQPGGSLHFKSTIQENLYEENLDLMNITIKLHQDHVLLSNVSFLDGNYTEIHRYYLKNLGHTLGDDAYAIFRGVSRWNLTLHETDLHIFLDDMAASYPLEIVTSKPLRLRPNNDVCFQNFFGGWQGHGFVALRADEMDLYDGRSAKPPEMEEIGRILQRFRNAAWQRYGIDGHHADCITLIKKDANHAEHVATVDDFEVLSQMVTKHWNGCVQTLSWFGMPMEKQVRIMSRSRSVFSLPGSDCMNAVFLPDNAVVVLPDRRLNETWQGSNEYRLWFKHAKWLRVYHYRPLVNQTSGPNTVSLNVNDTVHRLLGDGSPRL